MSLFFCSCDCVRFAELVAGREHASMPRLEAGNRVCLLVAETLIRLLVSSEADLTRAHVGFDPDVKGKYTAISKKRGRE